MPPVYRIRFQGDHKAGELVAAEIQGLKFEADAEWFWLKGDPLDLGSDDIGRRSRLDAFSRRANAIIALSDPNLSAIHPDGPIQIIDGERCDHVVLAECAYFEATFFPATVTLVARGGGLPPRPLGLRADELASRNPRFERAANILAECGEDLVRLFMVMELIELAHGYRRKMSTSERSALRRKLGVKDDEWKAAHRTARPHRHAEPDDMNGPALTPGQARSLIQHALKLWLEREVPI